MRDPEGNRSTTESESSPAPAVMRKRFEAEERQAVDAVARWVGHPAVRGVIERRRVGAETVVMPIERLLTGQIQVIRFCWHVFGLAGIEPGWNLRRGEPWKLTSTEMNMIDRVEADFRGVVQLAVNEMEGAGVGLVPSWAGDHVVVAELLLLDVAWDLPARELAEALQPLAIGAIHIDASGTIHRRGTWEKAETNLAALRRNYEQHLHGPRPRAPYAGGDARALPEPTRLRREAVAKVLDRFPNATSSKIATSFGDRKRQHGGLPASGSGLTTGRIPGQSVGARWSPTAWSTTGGAGTWWPGTWTGMPGVPSGSTGSSYRCRQGRASGPVRYHPTRRSRRGWRAESARRPGGTGPG